MKYNRTVHRIITASLLAMLFIIALVPASGETAPAPVYKAIAASMETQNAIDQALLAEAALGYTLEEPFCMVNPYGLVPLSAILIFDTPQETPVTMTVKGHAAEDDVTAEFPAATRHILTVVGLYANENNTVILSLPDGSTSTVMIQTESVDDETLLHGQVTVPASNHYNFTQLTFVSIGNTQCVVAYDSKGDLRYYAKFVGTTTTPLPQLENGHYLVIEDNTAKEEGNKGGFMEVDLCGRIYRKFILPGGFHHDICVLADGSFVVPSSQDDMAVRQAKLVEIDPETNDIVWELELGTLLDPTDGGSTLAKEVDWFHLNAIDYSEATNSLLLSGRAANTVLSYDLTAKKLNWILGNPEGWTTVDPSLFFTPAEGQADFEWNYAQHDATFLDSTHIMLFDNGTSRNKTVTPEAEQNTDYYSRAVVYEIDPDAMTIDQTWSYGKQLGTTWYSSHFCGVSYDETEGSYWICSGTTEYDTATQTYVADASAVADEATLQTHAKLDMVKGSDLLYELVLTAPAYRLFRLNPYTYAANTDLSTPGVTYTYERIK